MIKRLKNYVPRLAAATQLHKIRYPYTFPGRLPVYPRRCQEKVQPKIRPSLFTAIERWNPVDDRGMCGYITGNMFLLSAARVKSSRRLVRGITTGCARPLTVTVKSDGSHNKHSLRCPQRSCLRANDVRRLFRGRTVMTLLGSGRPDSISAKN